MVGLPLSSALTTSVSHAVSLARFRPRRSARALHHFEDPPRPWRPLRTSALASFLRSFSSARCRIASRRRLLVARIPLSDARDDRLSAYRVPTQVSQVFRGSVRRLLGVRRDRPWRLPLPLAVLGAALVSLVLGVAPSFSIAHRHWGPPPGWTADYVNAPTAPYTTDSTFRGEIVRNEAETVVLKEELHQEISEVPVEVALHVALVAVCPEAELLHAIATAKAAVSGLNLVQKLVRLKDDETYNNWLYFWFARYDPNVNGGARKTNVPFLSPGSQKQGPAFQNFVKKYQALVDAERAKSCSCRKATVRFPAAAASELSSPGRSTATAALQTGRAGTATESRSSRHAATYMPIEVNHLVYDGTETLTVKTGAQTWTGTRTMHLVFDRQYRTGVYPDPSKSTDLLSGSASDASGTVCTQNPQGASVGAFGPAPFDFSLISKGHYTITASPPGVTVIGCSKSFGAVGGNPLDGTTVQKSVDLTSGTAVAPLHAQGAATRATTTYHASFDATIAFGACPVSR
jgi:hypothetical protein